ncbi:glycoside hydrolase family 127 protein [Sphingomonas morindae]|uniref:Glycoside hydrolase family 127 protein n=2 Tax=Sphingomonas morindae TaxID=1541170 RepID=A0ABY4XD33_9SPHN|nr:glycoside hydrolase family 127 protein [Sphingomonas morindae]USI74585.1 glycoside hydrolase family 127 protein [Sphingomonas morindae]
MAMLAGQGGMARAAAAAAPGTGAALLPAHPRPLPLADVRLLPSPFLDAVTANHRYLLSLEPDRLLHNFRKGAGLAPKGAAYGGWEGDTIAGHTLGHYISALALLHAQTGDAEARRRVAYIVDELAACQRARGSGYVAGLLRKRKDGTQVDGEEIFHEIAAGDIRSGGFDLNGAWSPLYNIHKTFAGLLDAQALAGCDAALPVAVALGGYFQRVFAALDDQQMQAVLACEYGGLNESYAELAARTGDAQWLRVAERIRDAGVLVPLEQGEDVLPNKHANTQIPKLIGYARIYEVGGRETAGRTARFFWERVTGHHSYVIGGNADREYFFAPDAIAQHVTEQTCEHCNSYNMLKLTRHLYGWQPDGALFDYYERTHFNHILAAQDPATGLFTYMTPLMSGIKRDWSSPTGDFWCCVGTGMESHAKHGESIFWEGKDALIVNLYIPARATWRARGATVALATGYPFDGAVRLTLERLARPGAFTIALRIPGWAEGATLTVNGAPVEAARSAGYAVLRRRWRAGDTIGLALPLALRLEPTPGDPDLVTVLRGPLVLAGDLGPADQPAPPGAAPALVGADLLAGFTPVEPGRARFRTAGLGRPADLDFAPFYQAYNRRSAVYFKRFTDAAWGREKIAIAAEQARLADLAARSVDVMHLGEMQPERDHQLSSDISYPVVYRGRNGRDARSGGYFAFRMKAAPGPLILTATYWGEERNRAFDILVDGTRIATQTLDAQAPGRFVDIDYAVPEALTRGKVSVLIRFQPHAAHTAGPVFGVRLARPAGLPRA